MEIKSGDRALRAIMATGKNEPADAVGTLPLICLRIVPDVAGSDIPALAQLTSVGFKANPLIGSDGVAEVDTGPGTPEYVSASHVQLPVEQVLECKYAHFNAELPYGKVLKTYSEEELSSAPRAAVASVR